MDAPYYEEIAGKLHGRLIRLDDRLSGKEVTEITEMIDHNELGVALEWMAGALSEGEQPLSTERRAEILVLVDRIEMDDQVPRALALCPKG